MCSVCTACTCTMLKWHMLTLSNFNWLFHSLFWNELMRSVGVKWLNSFILLFLHKEKPTILWRKRAIRKLIHWYIVLSLIHFTWVNLSTLINKVVIAKTCGAIDVLSDHFRTKIIFLLSSIQFLIHCWLHSIHLTSGVS